MRYYQNVPTETVPCRRCRSYLDGKGWGCGCRAALSGHLLTIDAAPRPPIPALTVTLAPPASPHTHAPTLLPHTPVPLTNRCASPVRHPLHRRYSESIISLAASTNPHRSNDFSMVTTPKPRISVSSKRDAHFLEIEDAGQAGAQKWPKS